MSVAEKHLSKYYRELFEKRHKIIFNSKHFHARKELLEKVHDDYQKEQGLLLKK